MKIMLAVKGIYKDGKIELLEPINEVEEAELYIVVVPKSISKGSIEIINEEGESEDFPEWTMAECNRIAFTSLYMMKLQEENGFANSVLASESEDIWNDL
jgi:hypothetical protein